MNYYKRIRELREDHDLSQREVAEILNMIPLMRPLYHVHQAAQGVIENTIIP